MRPTLPVGALAASVQATTVTNDTSVAANRTFDYVVVGAGLTGITVANKLSEQGFSTLIIEAGPDARWNNRVYNAEDRVQHDPYCNWLYPAYDEDGSLLPATIDSGACIGGSTSINGMMWLRPTQTEVDKLEALGNPGWNWDSLEPYMAATERNTPPDAAQRAEGAGLDPEVHGFNGHINVSFPIPMRIPGAVKLYKEALPLAFPGLTIGNDLSNRSSDGTVSASSSWTIWYDSSTGEHRRSSAADGYLWAPEEQRDTLTVLANHKVDKILFGDDFAARSVVFGTKPGADVPGSLPGLQVVHANKEVILAAGFLASTSVLERSGVGSPGFLAAAGIEVLVDLPGVGVNLVDQPGTGTSALVAEAYQNDTSIIDRRNFFAPELSLVNINQIWGAESSDFYSQLTSPDNLEARAQELVAAGGAATLEGAKVILNTTIDLIVNHDYKFDQDVAVAVSRLSRTLFASAPFEQVVADPYYDPPIGLNGTVAEWLAWFKSTSYGASHWVGSTAMLPRDLGGVVDSKLQVYGTKNLRVVDAGILPFEITSHPMPLLYSVAQKAAALILDDSLIEQVHYAS
ncbi:hypothetical protein Daus18300_009855 [Diaporthe australafricana]|uniref:GMC oxidoreductase n=1 Tax=Diaporthe australafricana TaxID=127596 RepID=A0ABR3WCW3_9PEZI